MLSLSSLPRQSENELRWLCESESGSFETSRDVRSAVGIGVCVQPVSATPLVVYRLAFRSPRSFADVD
jgi:hypothetical protein